MRVAFIGWGAIISRVGALLHERKTPIEIVGVTTKDEPNARAAIPTGLRYLQHPDELRLVSPDLIVEAAGREAIEIWGAAAVASAPELVIASTSALTDDDFLLRLTNLAEKSNCRVIIPSGAIGGIDALSSAALLGLDNVVHQIVKPPIAWENTSAESKFDPRTLSERLVFFSGSARDAAKRYPQNANATVVTSLAGIGLDRTRVELIADPNVSRNTHHISASGAFGRMEVILENVALTTNPKSSELSALSLVRLIEQRTKTIVL